MKPRRAVPLGGGIKLALDDIGADDVGTERIWVSKEVGKGDGWEAVVVRVVCCKEFDHDNTGVREAVLLFDAESWTRVAKKVWEARVPIRSMMVICSQFGKAMSTCCDGSGIMLRVVVM